MDAVERAIVLPADRRAVWAVLTDTTLLRRWLGGEAELDVRPGGGGRVRAADGTVREVLVEGVAPERSLRFHWWPPDGAASTVDIELDDDAHGTRVTVTETLRPAARDAVESCLLALT
jgi:uncharacterized protein YndB with AHSA1/START domain